MLLHPPRLLPTLVQLPALSAKSPRFWDWPFTRQLREGPGSRHESKQAEPKLGCSGQHVVEIIGF